MATFSARDNAVRRVTRLMSHLAVMAAILSSSSYGGVVDALAVDGRVATRHAAAKSSGGSVFASCSVASPLGGMTGASNPPAAIIATRDASSGLGAQSLVEHSAGWQADFRASGYAAHPAFQEEWKVAAAADVASFADDGNNAADTWHGGAGHGSEWRKGIDLYAMPNWLRTVRLGLRTTAFTFYLSPSIPGMDGAAY